MLKHCSIVMLVLGVSATFGAAAEISRADLNGKPLVIVSGPLVAEDVQKFDAISANLQSATVLLKSEGGSLYAGVEIGRTIRRRGLATWVSSKDGRCASACGFAWLAGNPRLLDLGSMIGFHAVYTLDEGKTQINSVGNAIVGGYMRELGLTDQAIIYATQAGPNSMKWLSATDAKALNLRVKYLSDNDPMETAGQRLSTLDEATVPGKVLGATRVKTIKVRPIKSWADEVFSPALR